MRQIQQGAAQEMLKNDTGFKIWVEHLGFKVQGEGFRAQGAFQVKAHT